MNDSCRGQSFCIFQNTKFIFTSDFPMVFAREAAETEMALATQRMSVRTGEVARTGPAPRDTEPVASVSQKINLNQGGRKLGATGGPGPPIFGTWKTSVFYKQTHNQGLRQLFLTVTS